LRHRNQMRLDARCGYVIRDETLARAGLAASKVAPAARDTCPAGSAVPPDAYAVCAVDAELFTECSCPVLKMT